MAKKKDDIVEKIQGLTPEEKEKINKRLNPDPVVDVAQLKLLKKILSISEEVGIIQKDKNNTFHKYKYASEHAIKTALKPLFIRHQIVTKFDVVENSINNYGDSTQAIVSVRYSFIDAETGASINGEFTGEGVDKGDKATYKAITGAIKYILTSNFFIPTGDDPEGDDDTDKNPTKKVPVADQQRLKNEIDEINKTKSIEDLKEIWERYQSSKHVYSPRDLQIIKYYAANKKEELI